MTKSTTKTAPKAATKIAPKAARKNKVKLTSFIKKNADTYAAKTWVVFTTPNGTDGKRSKPCAFDPSFSRDQARGAYAQVMGVKKEDTRSKRVENY